MSLFKAGDRGDRGQHRLTAPRISMNEAGKVGGGGMLVLVSVLSMAKEEGAEHFQGEEVVPMVAPVVWALTSPLWGHWEYRIVCCFTMEVALSTSKCSFHNFCHSMVRSLCLSVR